MRTISILGVTGSVGASTLSLLEEAGDRFQVDAVVGGRDAEALARAARRMNARFAVIADPAAGRSLAAHLSGTSIAWGAGPAALCEAAARPVDITVAAISGIAGLAPTVAAFGPGRTIAVANKECLVAAGAFFMAEAARTGTTLLPMDSEHNAIFQALAAGRHEDVERVTLTASGGPFRTAGRAQIARARAADALKHPNWSMGAKITIDSATLMNKGLELIEAHHLFALAPERLDTVVHPESVIHGLVAFRDGSVVAGLGLPDMRVPIAHCLGYPARIDTSCRRLDLTRLGALTFEPPDLDRFPALGLALCALKAGGGAPTVLNGANEVAVAAFLAGQIGLLDIAAIVEDTLQVLPGGAAPEGVDAALELDRQARRIADALVPKFAAKASHISM